MYRNGTIIGRENDIVIVNSKYYRIKYYENKGMYLEEMDDDEVMVEEL